MTARADARCALDSLRKQTDTRNLREWIATACVGVGAIAVALSQESLLARLALGEIALAAAYIAWRLYRDGRVRVDADEVATDAGARRALARETTRQADLLAAAPWWYVAPIALGWCGLHAEAAVNRGVDVKLALIFASGCGFFVLVAVLNRVEARKLLASATALGA